MSNIQVHDSLDRKHVVELKNEINIGKGELQLWYDVIDNDTGKVLLTRRADSLLGNFIRGLYVQAAARKQSYCSGYLMTCGGGAVMTGMIWGGGGEVYNGLSGQYVNYRIQIDANGTPDTFKFSRNGGSSWITTGIPITVAAQEVEYGLMVKFAATTGNTIGNYWDCHVDRTVQNASMFRGYCSSGEEWYSIQVGTGSTAVHVWNNMLVTKVAHGTTSGKLSYSGATVAAPAVDATSAQCTITRDFANSSGGTISVAELGLNLLLSDSTDGAQFLWGMIARDVPVAPISVDTGKTLTVNYRIKTVLSGSLPGTTQGGFTRQFMDLLYRHLNAATYDCKNIYTETISAAANGGDFSMCAAGGYTGRTGDYRGSGSDFGIVVGTNNTAVSMTDTKLNTRIAHGSATGKLVHYGSTASDVLTNDPTTGIASFTISRLFENASGGSIVVAESGLDCGQSTADQALIVRRALAAGDQVTVLNGEVLKATYTIKVTV